MGELAAQLTGTDVERDAACTSAATEQSLQHKLGGVPPTHSPKHNTIQQRRASQAVHSVNTTAKKCENMSTNPQPPLAYPAASPAHQRPSIGLPFLPMTSDLPFTCSPPIV